MAREVFDYVVLGGGAAGCVMANRLSQKGTVCLIEAGPDYGSLANNKWPSEMLDARDIPQTHPWQNTANGFPPERSRIIGGSSAENNTFATWGSPSDYDLWEQYANGWNWQNINPYITRAKEMMKVRHWQEEEKKGGASLKHLAILLLMPTTVNGRTLMTILIIIQLISRPLIVLVT